MMELVDMPGMSAQFRICRMRTANSKKVGGTLNCPFCAPKLRVPEIWFGDVFCMRGGPFRKIAPSPPSADKFMIRLLESLSLRTNMPW